METTTTHGPEAVRHAVPATIRMGDRERGKTWPAVASTLALSMLGLGISRSVSARKGLLARLLRAEGLALVGASWVHLLFLRRWHLRWGATDEETQRFIPGDELVPHPHLEATRALTINAPPEAVWPWLVQMGYRRGGWYSYDWLDNLGVPSAKRIIPELQNLKVGDALAPAPSGFTVALLEPQRSLVLVTRDKKGRITSTWSFLVEPLSGGRTRFIERIRGAYTLDLWGLFWGLILEPADFVMMRKQMLTVKRRAEAALHS